MISVQRTECQYHLISADLQWLSSEWGDRWDVTWKWSVYQHGFKSSLTSPGYCTWEVHATSLHMKRTRINQMQQWISSLHKKDQLLPCKWYYRYSAPVFLFGNPEIYSYKFYIKKIYCMSCFKIHLFCFFFFFFANFNKMDESVINS